MNARRVARWLSRLFPDREEAAAFIEDALRDAATPLRALRVVRTAIRDALAIRMRGASLPISVSGASVGDAAPPTSPSWSFVMDQFAHDVRFGIRQLRRYPAYALAAILTMALGIGANTAIFSVAWQSALKPLPYPKSRELVEVWETFKNGQRNFSLPAKFFDLRREASSFAKIAAYGGIRSSVDITGAGEPEQLTIRRVTGDYFDVFAMPPLAGRTLRAEDVSGGGNAVVISEELWQRRFARSASAVGATIRLDGAPGRIVGVMPAAFGVSAGRVDVWVPLSLPPETMRRTGHFVRVVARLKDGVSVEAADNEARTIAARAAAAYPDTDGKLSAWVEPLSRGRSTDALRAGLLMLALASAAVWLMTCANLAGLQLARGVSRAHEFGIRAALGAGRSRVIRQLLAEGLVISLIGGAAGLFAANLVLRVLATMAPAAIAPAVEARPDTAVFLFAGALSLVSALAFSLAPAWRAATTASHWLRQRGGGGDRDTARTRLALVTAQVASAFVLLVAATMLIWSLARVRSVNPGFTSDGVLAFDITAPRVDQADSFTATSALFRSVIDNVAAIPGVVAACATNEVPFDPQFNMTYVPAGQTEPVSAYPRTVTPGCFDTFGISITRGRSFSDHESGRVAIVTESFARRAWPGQDPIGQRFHEGVAEGALLEVVGVASDALQESLEQRPHPIMYEAWTAGASFPPARIAARADVAPASLFSAVRNTVRRVDKDQAVGRLRALADMRERSLAGRRFDLTLLASFAGVALVLAVVGVYGLLSQIVAQRTREIGVRLALGATHGSVVRLMLGSAAVALAAGLPVGLAGAAAAAKLVSGFLFGVSAANPLVYAGVALVLSAAVLAAAWLPARRAARVDPSQTVRA
jgi:putative ABC transport system permease protein